MVEQFLVLPDEVAQFFRQGKGQHEIGDRQQELALNSQPFFGAFMLAFGTMPIAAGVIGEMRLPARGTGIDLPAQRFGAAVFNCPHRLAMAGQDTIGVLATILGAVPPEDIRQFYCQSFATISLMVSLACVLTVEVR